MARLGKPAYLLSPFFSWNRLGGSHGHIRRQHRSRTPSIRFVSSRKIRLGWSVTGSVVLRVVCITEVEGFARTYLNRLTWSCTFQNRCISVAFLSRLHCFQNLTCGNEVARPTIQLHSFRSRQKRGRGIWRLLLSFLPPLCLCSLAATTLWSHGICASLWASRLTLE